MNGKPFLTAGDKIGVAPGSSTDRRGAASVSPAALNRKFNRLKAAEFIEFLEYIFGAICAKSDGVTSPPRQESRGLNPMMAGPRRPSALSTGATLTKTKR